MLNDKQIECIELMAQGMLTNKEIADKLKISDRAIYKWKNNDEFKAEWERRSHEIQTALEQEGKCRMVAKGQMAIDNIINIANTSNSEKVKLDANTFIYEVIFGKASSKTSLTVEDNRKDDGTSDDMLADVLGIDEDNTEQE